MWFIYRMVPKGRFELPSKFCTGTWNQRVYQFHHFGFEENKLKKNKCEHIYTHIYKNKYKEKFYPFAFMINPLLPAKMLAGGVVDKNFSGSWKFVVVISFGFTEPVNNLAGSRVSGFISL